MDVLKDSFNGSRYVVGIAVLDVCGDYCELKTPVIRRFACSCSLYYFCNMLSFNV